MVQSPLNNVIVKVKSLFTRPISDFTKTAFAEVNGTDLNPADFVTITGEVVSIPRTISKKMDYKGFSTSDIRVGDIAIFSYSVIYDFDVSDENQKFMNCFWYKGQEYWIADIQKVFGVVREGKILMVNGYCMIEGIRPISTLLLPHHLKRMLNVSEATLTHGSERGRSIGNIEMMPMDTVFYNPLKVQKYKIADKEIGIIERKHILGNKIAEYSNIQQLN